MRYLLLFLLLFVSLSAKIVFAYENQVTVSTATLGITTSEIKKAAQNALTTYGWQVEERTDTHVTGNLQGRGASKVEVNYPGSESFTIKYLTEHDLENYKFYRRLLNIRAIMMLDLTDCKNLDVDPSVVLRKNLIFAFSKYHWNIKSITHSKVVASLPARGRIEADISEGGTVKIRRWDEIEEDFTDENKDGYVRRVKTVFENQQRRCAK